MKFWEVTMSFPTAIRNGKTYVGDTNKKQVHDQSREDINLDGCQIDRLLREGHGVGFIPDTLSQANAEGYDNCPKCIGDSTI